MKDDRQSSFPAAQEDLTVARETPDTPQTRSPAYRLAYDDPEFLLRDEMRAVRLQLELRKPELALDDLGIESTVVFFGGARIPSAELCGTTGCTGLENLSRYYEEARQLAFLITRDSLAHGGHHNMVVTGGGPGVMEAGNRGAAEAGGKSVGLNIVLPHEQMPNHYVTPELCFNFHYFAIRKMHFLMRARAVVVFPGGFGTLDETFETLTLVQTKRMEPLPILLFGRDFWEEIINWDALARIGTISQRDLDLFHYVETAEEAFAALKEAQDV
jgi:uncharacterized protein (TIGR00730 family)